jgi:hypothetical protein
MQYLEFVNLIGNKKLCILLLDTQLNSSMKCEKYERTYDNYRYCQPENNWGA